MIYTFTNFLLFGYSVLNPPGKTAERYSCDPQGAISTGEGFIATMYMTSFVFTKYLQPWVHVYV